MPVTPSFSTPFVAAGAWLRALLNLGWATLAGAFGAAESLVIVVMWLYYCAQLFLIGVAFNEAWSARQGQPV